VVFAGVCGKRGYQDGPSNTALFDSPHGIDLDPNGNVIVADSANDAIRIVIVDAVSAAGGTGNNKGSPFNVYTILGGPDTRGLADGDFFTAQFNTPTDVRFDPTDDTLVVLDSGNRLVRSVLTTVRGSNNKRCPLSPTKNTPGHFNLLLVSTNLLWASFVLAAVTVHCRIRRLRDENSSESVEKRNENSSDLEFGGNPTLRLTGCRSAGSSVSSSECYQPLLTSGSYEPPSPK